MAKVTIDRNKCKGCLLCIAACPRHSIKKDDAVNARGNNCVIFSEDGGCIGCCVCAVVCPDCCIEVYK